MKERNISFDGIGDNVEKTKEDCLEEEAFAMGPEHWVECDLVEKGKSLPRLSMAPDFF